MSDNSKIILYTFGYKWGQPAEDFDGNRFDEVIDCRVLRNPHNNKNLREFNGKHPRVQTAVRTSYGASDFLYKVYERVKDGGIFAIGCAGGKHRSVAVAEMLAEYFGDIVEVTHLDIDRKHK